MIREVVESTVGGENRSVTINYEDGSSREITEQSGGGVTVVDTNQTGEQVVGDGVRGTFGTLADSVRINQR